MFLAFSELQKLKEKYRIYFKNKLNLEAFVVNLYNVEEEDLKRKLQISLSTIYVYIILIRCEVL